MDEPLHISSVPVNPMIGVKLGGQYTILSALGEGGLGTVYRAHQETVDRLVAIKFLPAALADDQIVVKRLAREAKALGRMNHPNIVTTYDFGFTDKQEPYLVLELVDGESLLSALERVGHMPFGDCLPIFIQLADAMKYAHANGVVHRDLKPHNIMLIEKDGKTIAKILDFGIAQMESESQKLTLAGEIWGSPYYMSPEQCSEGEITHLTDIYSLGLVMYMTLSGRLPHQGSSFPEVVSQKLFEPIPFFASLDLPQPITVPEGLEAVVQKCLRRDADERYQTMDDLKMALVAFAKKAKLTDGGTRVYSGEELGKGVKTPQAETVNKPNSLHKPQKPSPPRNTNSSSKGTARVSSATKAKGSGQSAVPKVILPVMAIVAVLMVAAMGLMAGMALQYIPNSKPAAQPTASPTPSPIVSPMPSPIASPTPSPIASPMPGSSASPKAGPIGTTSPASGLTAIPAAKAAADYLEKNVADPVEKSPAAGTASVDVDRSPVRAKSVVPAKKITKAVKTPLRSRHQARGVAAETNVEPAGNVPDSTPESAPHLRADDPNSFYGKWGGVKDSH